MSLAADWYIWAHGKLTGKQGPEPEPNTLGVAGLIYDGFLPYEIAESIRRSDYHYWAEILINSEPDPETRQRSKRWLGFCDAFHKWSYGPDGLVMYDLCRDGEWGSRKEYYKSLRYCMNGRFWGFFSEAEHARFCARFGPEIVNPKPFKTVLFG